MGMMQVISANYMNMYMYKEHHCLTENIMDMHGATTPQFKGSRFEIGRDSYILREVETNTQISKTSQTNHYQSYTRNTLYTYTHTHAHTYRLGGASWSPLWVWPRPPFPSSSAVTLPSPSLLDPPLFSKEPDLCLPDEEGGRAGTWRDLGAPPLPTRSSL